VEKKNNEKEELEALLESARFKARFWATILRWAAWGLALIVGVPTVAEAVGKILAWFKQ